MKQEEMPPTELAKMTVVYSIPGMETVRVLRDVPYRSTESGSLCFDVYYPPGSAADSQLPAVLFVHGYSDAGVPNLFGRTFKQMGHPVSWAQLIAASGMVAILYSNRQPVDDLEAILQHLRDHAVGLGIDRNRLGLFATSGHVPLGLSLLMQPERREVRCAVFCCGYMLDLNGATSVADMQKLYPFANPCAGKSMEDVRRDVPMLVARAGRDQFGVNESLDSFIAGALHQDLPVRLVNHPGVPHAFDLFDDTEATREIIREILRFMQFHLVGPVLSAFAKATADSPKLEERRRLDGPKRSKA
jgi:dienelactone hydrolase